MFFFEFFGQIAVTLCSPAMAAELKLESVKILQDTPSLGRSDELGNIEE